MFYSIASNRMRCNPSARWGPGTTKEKPLDTEASKEIKAKMEQLIKEREKQDSMWTHPVSSEKEKQVEK